MSKIWSIATQCLSKTRESLIFAQSDIDQDELEEIVHYLEGDAWVDKLVVDQATTLGCLLSVHPSSIDNVNGITHRLSVVGAL